MYGASPLQIFPGAHPQNFCSRSVALPKYLVKDAIHPGPIRPRGAIAPSGQGSRSRVRTRPVSRVVFKVRLLLSARLEHSM